MHRADLESALGEFIGHLLGGALGAPEGFVRGDHHPRAAVEDPLAHLQVTTAAFPRLYRTLKQLAAEACGGRWVALGGGGYNPDFVPRAWTMLFATMLGVELEDELPPAWREHAEAALGRVVTSTLMGDVEPIVSGPERMRADQEGHLVVDQARMLLST